MSKKIIAPELKIFKKSELKWVGKFSGDYQECNFLFFKDKNDKVWINNILVAPNYQEMGFGTKLMEAVLKEYGIIYVSTASKSDILALKDSSDSRFMNDWDGDLLPFILKLIDKGIIKKEWVQNPCKPGREPNEDIRNWLNEYLEMAKRAEPLDKRQTRIKQLVVKFLRTIN